MNKLDNDLMQPLDSTEAPAASPTPPIVKPTATDLLNAFEAWAARVVESQNRMATDEAYRQEIEKRLF